MRQTINGADFRRLIISAAASIEIHKQSINELNVFPVPDGDTGTNMSMTIQSAVTDLKKAEDPTLEKAASIAASAMLRGARGNSGVILSLLFRGISKALKGVSECDGVLWAKALQEGVDAAYKAVMKPAEGTILTVARLSAAKAGQAAQENSYFEFVHEAAVEEARVALANTVNQNPVLKKAGVIDAGGKGWLWALEAMLLALRGEDVTISESAPVEPPKEQADFSEFNTEDITFTYCTEFIVSRETSRDPEELRAFLQELGDSLVLVDDDEIIKVHVHTNNPGTALQEALTYGSFVTVKIENMRLQHTEKVMSEQELQPQIAPPEKKFGVVTVCAGDGIASVFRDLGVDGVISGGQTMNPSTQDILTAVNQVPAETVFVLGMGGQTLSRILEEGRERLHGASLVLGAQTESMLVTRGDYAALLGREAVLATDDGSVGHAGFCTEPVRAQLATGEYAGVFCCGPEPLMRAVAGLAREAGVACWVSMEKRMACGVGACLSCVVETHEGKRRSCVDGPVFNAKDVVW